MAISRRAALLGGTGLVVGGAALVTSKRRNPDPVSEGSVREVAEIVVAEPTRDGAGVRLNRALGGRALSMLDPFLLLDEFKTDNPGDYIAGFPDHPHRGFETVTYMIHGAMEHKDSVGNRGRLVPGSAQWMTAGHGIVHSEMPKQESGLMWGFQLWVNLPRARKLIAPRYQDIAPDRIAEVTPERARVRVVAGRAFGVEGPVTGIDVDPLFLDVTLQRGGTIAHAVPDGHNAFVFVTDGALRVGARAREVKRGELAVLAPGRDFMAHADAEHGGRALLLAGRPLNEPVARYGPFVMSTQDEIREAFADYRSGKLVTM